MRSIKDENQSELDLGLVLNGQKEKRKQFHRIKKTVFVTNNQLSLENLMKLTYDITDKDFEYFYAELMKKQGFENVEVAGGYLDEGVDIYGSKNGIKYFVQCKQLATKNIDEKKIGEYYGTVFHKKKDNPNVQLQYVTTSYLLDRAKEFCKYNSIEYIDNTKLILLCNKFDIFSDGNWQEIRKKIYQNRLDFLKKDYGSIDLKNILKNNIIEEFKNHLPPSKRNHTFFHRNIKSPVTEVIELLEAL